jgi:site-specific recombinase XerD
MDNMILFKEKLLLRNMSSRTIELYSRTIQLVSERIGIDIDLITEDDLKNHILNDKKRAVSTSTQMGIINAFKVYFKEIKKIKFDTEILPRPKIYQRQQDILSIEEMQKIIDCTQNLKHRAIIILMYSCALRVSEVINLKINDIDSKNKKLNIRSSKGMIDRVVMLDNKLLETLRFYWKTYQTKEYVFEGSKGGKYSTNSIQNIIKTKAKLAGINKRISSHSMRHSCLTQLIKNGVDLRRVQKIAGHKNINTTANYIKIIDSDVLDTESPISAIRI